MTTDKILEIKERHERDEKLRAESMIPVLDEEAHDDRATLLDEVERLREEMDKLRGTIARPTVAKIRHIYGAVTVDKEDGR